MSTFNIGVLCTLMLLIGFCLGIIHSATVMSEYYVPKRVLEAKGVIELTDEDTGGFEWVTGRVLDE